MEINKSISVFIKAVYGNFSLLSQASFKRYLNTNIKSIEVTNFDERVGIKQANKVMHLSAIAYNLKKYLKFIDKKVKSGAATLNLSKCIKTTFYDLFGFEINPSKITIPYQIL